MLDFSLLDRGFGEKRPAEELVLLLDSLEENICNSAGAFVSPIGEKSDFNVHHNDLRRKTKEALSWVAKNDLLGLIHTGIALGNKGFILHRILDVESGVF